MSSRLKISIITTALLMIVGVAAFLYDPIHIGGFATYIINTVLPVLAYIGGRTMRTGKAEKGIVIKSTRYRTALITFIVSLIIGIFSYMYSPENIGELGVYMLGVVVPSMSYILGRSFKPNRPEETVNTENDSLI
jgi:hypothetical protein